MKKLFLLIMVMLSYVLIGQTLKKENLIKFNIVTSNVTSFDLYFTIINSEFREVDFKTMTLKEFNDYSTILAEDTIIYSTINRGEFWYETQTFVITLDRGKDYVQYLKVVQNVGKEPCTVYGKGTIEKIKT